MATDTVIEVYKPRSRQKEATIASLTPRLTLNALAERLGQEAANKARSTLKHLEEVDGDLAQYRLGDRRIRVKRGSEPLEA
jgi:hypothetical protein